MENERYKMSGFENINIPWPGWEIVKELGEGSYGKVYEIERTQYGITENDALKIIRIPKNRAQYDAVAYSLASEDEESIKEVFSDQKDKLINEVREIKKLKVTDNIVDIKDWSVSKLDDGYSWEIYIRMDLLTPLVQYVKKNKGLEEAEVIKLGEDICRALVECEKEKIVHRDIKPENIMVSESGKYKLGDFGIARYLEDDTTMTAGAGTRAYMAPEINNIEKAGKTVDIYSLGLVLYEMLNNCRPPFLSANGKISGLEMANAIQRRLRGEELPEPANGSDALKKIALKACDPVPSKRYRTAAAMLKALEKLPINEDRKKKEADETAAEQEFRFGDYTVLKDPASDKPEDLYLDVIPRPGSEQEPEPVEKSAFEAPKYEEPAFEEPAEWGEDHKDNTENRDPDLEIRKPEEEVEELKKRLKELTGIDIECDDTVEEPVPAVLDKIKPAPEEIRPEPATEEKTSDALSLEDIEKDLFGEVPSAEAEAEETKKIDKFYTLYRKNQEFQRLLDEEHDKLKGEKPAGAAAASARVAKKDGKGEKRKNVFIKTVGILGAVFLAIVMLCIVVLQVAPDSGFALMIDSLIEKVFYTETTDIKPPTAVSGHYLEERETIGGWTCGVYELDEPISNAEWVEIGVKLLDVEGVPDGSYRLYFRSGDSWDNYWAIDIEESNKTYTDRYALESDDTVEALALVPDSANPDKYSSQFEVTAVGSIE